VVLILRVSAGDIPPKFFQAANFDDVFLLTRLCYQLGQVPPFWIPSAPFPSCVLGNEFILDVSVKFIEDNVGEDGAEDTTLDCTRVGCVVTPFFHIASLEHPLK
jgi:hypothetical protein